MSNYRGRSYSRGRGFNNNRGQSPAQRNYNPTRGRGRRNFFDENVANEEQQKKDNKVEQIIEKKEIEKPKVDKEKREELINKGKQWFNKWFGGFKKKDRANVLVEYNSDLDLELYSAYVSRLQSLSTSNYYYQTDDVKRAPTFFRSYINILLGIKLLKSNSDTNKGIMKKFQPLTLMELDIPKNLNVIIEGLGKTDAYGDNVIRMIGQNSMIKNHFFKAIYNAVTLDRRQYFDNMVWVDGYKYDDARNFRNNHILKESTLKLYSNDRSGVEIINEYGKQGIEFLNKHDFEIKIVDQTVKIRLPYLDPKFSGDIEKILEWEKSVSTFFTAVKFDPGAYRKTIGIALLGWMPLRFIVEKNKVFKDIDKRFDKTIFSLLKPSEILAGDNWYCTNDFMNDDQIFENIVYLVQTYNNKFKRIFEDIFHMVKFNPSEFGNSSQIVMGHKTKGVYIDDNEYNDVVQVVKNDKPTVSYLKMNEEESIIGSVFKICNHVRFKSGYDINLIGTTNEIRQSFVSHDFK